MTAAERVDDNAKHPAMQALLDATPEQRRKAIKGMPPRDRVRLLYDWTFWARRSQLWRPGPEMHTFYLAGRGWGKTATGGGAVQYVAEHPELAGGRKKQGRWDRDHGNGAVIGIAGRTANDVNETMLYGPSGLITRSPPWFRPRHFASRKLLVWPNGCVARLMSGDVPDSFRGPNFGFVWTDELAHWAKLKRSLSMLKLTLRHGKNPRAVHTTTPIGVEPLVEMLFALDDARLPRPARPGEPELQGFAIKDRVRIVKGSTYDNAANLASDFLSETVAEYEGTEEGDQELHGIILFGARGAPWRRDWIERCEPDDVPELALVVVGVDPTVSDGEINDNDEPCECGIVCVGVGVDGMVYVLEDASGVMSTREWGAKAIEVAERHGADFLAVEENNGGELVETALRYVSPRRRRIRIHRVRATKDKFKRAGLVAPMWEARRVRHVGSPRRFVKVEHQMCNFDPRKGPRGQLSDRMDALVWAMLAAVGDGTDRRRLRALSDPAAWRKIAAELRARSRGR